MSAPFGGTPEIGAASRDAVHADLAARDRPRKHYQRYSGARAANADMWRCPRGVHDFLRAYYHHKSADWAANRPFKLTGWTATELAKMPTYYIMDRDRNMAETVAAEMPTPAEIAANRWLTDAEMRVYSGEYERTGFQGGLQWYRTRIVGGLNQEQEIFAGRTIDVPSVFIAGASDWGVQQTPGAVERMREVACTRMAGVHLIPGAGHWVQQEQPEETVRLLLDFLRTEARVAP